MVQDELMKLFDYDTITSGNIADAIEALDYDMRFKTWHEAGLKQWLVKLVMAWLKDIGAVEMNHRITLCEPKADTMKLIRASTYTRVEVKRDRKKMIDKGFTVVEEGPGSNFFNGAHIASLEMQFALGTETFADGTIFQNGSGGKKGFWYQRALWVSGKEPELWFTSKAALKQQKEHAASI